MDNSKNYTVKKGDTAYSIAKNRNIPMAELQRANSGKNLDKLAIGQLLILPQKTVVPKETNYTVKKGDTAYDIAKSKNISLTELQKANSGKNLNKLAIGQLLNLPNATSASQKQTIKPSAKTATPTKTVVPQKTTLSTAQIKDKIKAEAKKQGVDENLALAVVEQESQFKPNAKSPTGAAGLFQLTKIAAKQVGGEKTYDVDSNIKTGTKYLKWCLDHSSTDEEALVAYNRGLSAMKSARKKGIPIDSITDKKNGHGYAKNVLDIFERNKKS